MHNPSLDKGFWVAFGLGALAGLGLYVRLCQILDAHEAKVTYL